MVSDGISSKLKNSALLWLFQYVLPHISLMVGIIPQIDVVKAAQPKMAGRSRCEHGEGRKIPERVQGGEGAEADHRKAAQG